MRGRAAAMYLALLGCKTPVANLGPFASAGGTGEDGATSAATAVDGASGLDGDESTDASTTDASRDPPGPKLDVGSDARLCEVQDRGGNAPGLCDQVGPPDAFEANLEWAWQGDGEDRYVIATPLVANLTDDDASTTIDLCDTPDVVVLAFPPLDPDNIIVDGRGHIYALDGATGQQHWATAEDVWWLGNPALGDIDGDGLVEIVAATTSLGPVSAWNHDGTPLASWSSSYVEPGNPHSPSYELASAIAIADLDHDGAPEVVVGTIVFDNTGAVLADLPGAQQQTYGTTAAIDLDEDGETELIVGNVAYTYHGPGSFSLYFDHPELGAAHPHVADLDGDGAAEVVLISVQGVSVLDAQGNVVAGPHRPGGGPGWGRAAVLHDFDANGRPDMALSVAAEYRLVVFDDTMMPPQFVVAGAWPVLDATGQATGTAFDFLGDASAEAMYGDEDVLWVFDSADDQVPPLVGEPRSSRTLIEYPVVVDVDNDGSAEIVVVSNENLSGEVASPPVQVFGDLQDRWIQARRIWNQHTYHITNVREDGTIPEVEPPHWKSFNTYRSNAQIEGGVLCVPAG